MAKVIAIANQKGGVGKTTTAVNLSSCVSALGKKVLIVDLDPQGNTTTGYGIPKRSVEYGTYEVLIGKATAAQAIRKTEFRTDVIGSNTRLAGASLEMIDLPGRESRLRKALAGVQKDYDFIFIDCPPSLDLLTLNGLSACDSVLIPVQCEYYALEGLSELISTLKTIRKKYNPYLDIEGVVFTMFSLRYNLTVQVVEQVQKYFGSKVYKTTITGSPSISTSPRARAAKRTWIWPLSSSRTTGRTSPKRPARGARALRNRHRSKTLWKTKTQGEQQEQWQKEKEDLAAGWKVCLRTPPRALSPTQRSRPCPCVRSSRTPTSPARPLTKRHWGSWPPALRSTVCCSPLRCGPRDWAATASWPASAGGVPAAWPA